MDSFRLEPTPNALRNGRLRLYLFAAFVVVLLGLIVLVPGFADARLVAVTAATCVALTGDAIAYLGQPTVTRYRLGVLVTTVAIVVGLYLALFHPFT